MNKTLFITFLLTYTTTTLWAQKPVEKNIELKNDLISFSTRIKNKVLETEHLSFRNDSISKKNIVTDGDFSFDIVWTDWLPPGKHNNGENPIQLTKKDFEFESYSTKTLPNKTQLLYTYYKGKHHHLQLAITYQIQPDKYYIKRKVAIRDTLYNKHFLQKISPIYATLRNPKIIRPKKIGGFGQPVAFHFDNKGFFFGLEYPASINTIKTVEKKLKLNSYQQVGKNISQNWIESEWVVLGLTPNSYLKKGFFKYLNDIKVSSNKPYTLYNSWYDLRGPKYPVGTYVKKMQDIDYMGQKNVFRLYKSFKQNFINKYDIVLDAFVLDDGWDIYASPWQLNKIVFPNGLTPIVDRFKNNTTQLGMWFGPSGGYSARMKRINWYKENGYEVVGEEKKWGGAMLCLAGKKYSEVFKERTLQFVKQGVTYYKWDGFQFSCSEITHGHPIGIYSQTAILDTLISSIKNIHKTNPNVYHSVTSGTWLSPWWLKYANQIWMQGEDYGYANVPSYSQRDASITYRDLILYDDFKKKKYWFPISNMMTHGIIKGKLEQLHITEPLDKFADNAILYFARGISMYELYTSPDIMNEKEWKVIAQSLKWAKHNFNTLMNTEMIGGDPEQKLAYGYLHLKKNKGILAARNPYIKKQNLKVTLSPQFGLDSDTKNLVLEQVYPRRWISPKIYKSGDSISIPLKGYETAIYEIYPLHNNHEPLPVGVSFETQKDDTGNWVINYHDGNSPLLFLNKNNIESIEHQNENVNPTQSKSLKNNGITFSSQTMNDAIQVNIDCGQNIETATLGLLLESDKSYEGRLPHISIKMDEQLIHPNLNGNPINKDQKMPNKKSGWYSFDIKKGKHKLVLTIDKDWSGIINTWLIGYQSKLYRSAIIKMKKDVNPKVLPPKTYPIEKTKIVKNIGSILVK